MCIRDRQPEFAADELVARSDAAGQALFEGLAPGRVRVSLDRCGYRVASIAAGQRAEVVLPGFQTAGAYRPRRVLGVVVDEHGAPVAGAEVRVSIGANCALLGGGCGLVATHSAQDGTFSLRDVDTPAVLEARAPGYARSRLDAELVTRMRHDDESPEVRVRLVLPGRAPCATPGVLSSRARSCRSGPTRPSS